MDRHNVLRLTAIVLYYINLYSPRNGSNTKARQHKHKYRQNERKDQVSQKQMTPSTEV